MQVEGTGVVVTGAGSGLGRAVANRLATAGAAVGVVDLSIDAATETATGCGGDSRPVAIDVADAAGSEAAFAALVDGLAPLRVLVCCAGIQQGARVVRRDGPVSLDWFRRTIEVNLTGTFNWVRLFASHVAALDPVDRDGQRGVIVMTSSITATDGVDGGVAYAAAKAGVAGMTLPLARELAPIGVRVVSVAPGTFATPMIATMPVDYSAALAAQVPHPRRFGDPDEFAALVSSIVANDYLNGEVIRLDGGLRMPPSSAIRPA